MNLYEDQDDQPAGAPAWALSFGDLMALLLSMFVMLAAMSELRQSDKYQGVADSLQDQFGDNRNVRVGPGELKPRNPSLAALAVAGRARRAELIGNEPIHIGIALQFPAGTSQLSPEAGEQLARLARSLPQGRETIEVNGLVGPASSAGGLEGQSPWEIALAQSQATVHYLTTDLQIDPRRIHLSVRGPEGSIVPATAGEAPQVEVRIVPLRDSAVGRAANREQPLLQRR